MGDPSRSSSPGPSTPGPSTPDHFYSLLGIPKTATIKDLCKGFKKWSADKSPSHKSHARKEGKDKSMNGKEQDEYVISNPTTPVGLYNHFNHRLDDFSPRSASILTSRRSTTPTPNSPSFSRFRSRRSTTLTSVSSSKSRRSNSVSEFPQSLSRLMSGMPGSPLGELARRNMSGSEWSSFGETPKHINGECSCFSESTPQTSNMCRSTSDNDVTAPNINNLSTAASRRNIVTPIVFSQSSASRKKPPPIEKKLECTLEELCLGCVRKILITRDVLMHGIIVQDEEIVKIEVQPGWQKGTKIRFEGKGDEKPGYLPADIIFGVDEKHHHLYRRDGYDLELGVEIPLVNALTNCSISVPLLGGEKMSLTIDNIIYPGFVKVIRGQGMPNPNQGGRRGDLKIIFLVSFPVDLSDEQRAEAFRILQDCDF